MLNTKHKCKLKFHIQKFTTSLDTQGQVWCHDGGAAYGIENYHNQNTFIDFSDGNES